MIARSVNGFTPIPRPRPSSRSPASALPWYADRPVIDMMGLTDRHIGRRVMPEMGRGPAGHEKGDGAYVLSRRPDIILFDKGMLFPTEKSTAEVLQQARGVSELDIASAPEFARDYELRPRRRLPESALLRTKP